MERFVNYFKFDYENDTAIEYVNTGLYSSLNCSFTSEDPNCGTDTIRFNSEPAMNYMDMVREQLEEIKSYLDVTKDGYYRDFATAEENIVFGDYSNSMLYAIEKALSEIERRAK